MTYSTPEIPSDRPWRWPRRSPSRSAQVPHDPGSKAIPLSKVERKNKAPVSDEILRVKIPKPTEIHLPNGLTVLVLEDHRLPLVTARLTILGAGALNDPADVPGLADVTAAMLREGTETRSSKQIAEESEGLGATIGAQAPWGSETATFTASGLSDNAGPVDRARIRRFAESFVSRERAGQAETAHENPVAAAALHRRVPDAGALRPGGLRPSSRRRHVAHAGSSRQDHAGDARRVARYAIPA